MIAYYRALIAKLQQEKQKLINLKAALTGSVVPSLNELKNKLSDAALELLSSYLLNNESADNKTISNNSESIENMSSTITGSVIPAIDARIAAIDAEIAQLEALIAALIEEERRAAEAAAAAAAAAASSGRRGAR